MATTARSRPGGGFDIHDDHTLALGELPLSNIQNIQTISSSIESLARQLDNFHIYNNDKENKLSCAVEVSSTQVEASSLDIDGNSPEEFHAPAGAHTKHVSFDFEDAEDRGPLASASQRLPSVQEQLSKHQEGQFEWLLSIPVDSVARGRRPRGDSHGDAELRRGEKTLFFGCNLVQRRSLSGGALDDNGQPTDVYTILATRVVGEEDIAMDAVAEAERMEAAGQDHVRYDETLTPRRLQEALEIPKSPRLAVEVQELSRPVSRIEDSVEALDKLEEEIEALSEVAQLETRVRSPAGAKAGTQSHTGAGTKPSPLRRAASMRETASPTRANTVGHSASVRKAASTSSTKEDEKAAAGSSSRKVTRPTSLLPPKPPARSSKPPTVSTFELPGEAVARRLKEQREQRRSQHLSSEQAAAVAAAYSPAKPHFKSTKPPTRPTFELPGEAISRKKREEREARLRAQEEEERKRREFKARPIRASLAPSSVPRDTLASLARQKQRQTEGSSDSAATTITPASRSSKRQSVLIPAAPSTSSATTPITTTTTTLPARGRPSPNTRQPSTTTTPTPTAAGGTSAHRSGSTSTAVSGQSSNRSATAAAGVSAEEAAAQKQRGKAVFARDNAYTAERERERREREAAAARARHEAAERSRMLSREWAERQRRGKREGVVGGVVGRV